MRSFIKSHRRGSSTNISEGSFLAELNTSTTASDGQLDEKQNGSISATSSAQSSPIRQSPSSPIVNKGKKLHRLFQRNKNSSQNLFNLSLASPLSPKKSPPPSIIGTRTHEWGNGSSESAKNTSGRRSANRVSTQSSQSSVNSISSIDDSNLQSSTSNHMKDPFNVPSVNEEDESIQLPLNTVIELPNETFLGPYMREIPTSVEMDKKSRHRRAQIISSDSFKLEDPAEIIPTAELQKHKEISSPDLFNDGFVDPDETVAEAIQNQKRRQRESKSESKSEVDEEKTQDPESESDGGSEFSFEQDNKQGRNVSIRYYKSPAEDLEERRFHLVKEQGFYVNDLIDDNFDEDLNYYDEHDDDYNDDEEIFNKKYFSDDEDDFPPKMGVSNVPLTDSQKVTPQVTFTEHENKHLGDFESPENPDNFFGPEEEDDEVIHQDATVLDEPNEEKIDEPGALQAKELKETVDEGEEEGKDEEINEQRDAKEEKEEAGQLVNNDKENFEPVDQHDEKKDVEQLIKPINGTARHLYPNHKNGSFHGSLLNLNNSPSRAYDDLLKPRRSLKYHQVATSLDQDVLPNRYSWLSEDEDFHNHGDQPNSSYSYDSLLDEINGVADDSDYEFEKKDSLPSRSKSMNSSLRREKGVFENGPQNTKFESNNKTVTLFNRPSRQNSVKSNNSAEGNHQQGFGYMTPNGSFTLPNPMFVNNQNNELSPITEGSIDGSP